MSKRRDFWIKIMMVIPQLEHSNHACENCGIIAITRMAWGIPPLQSVVLRDITGNDVTCNSSVQLMQSGWLRWFLLSLAKVARIRGFRIYSYSSYHTYSPVCMSKLILFSFQRDPTLTTAFADSEWMIHSHSLIQSNHCSFIFSCTVDCIVVRGDRIAITFLQSLKIRVRLAICFRDLMSFEFHRRAIFATTGAKVRVRGRGSGHQDSCQQRGLSHINQRKCVIAFLAPIYEAMYLQKSGMQLVVFPSLNLLLHTHADSKCEFFGVRFTLSGSWE